MEAFFIGKSFKIDIIIVPLSSNEDMAFTLSTQVCFEEDIKKSRFQAIAVPVENEQAVKDF